MVDGIQYLGAVESGGIGGGVVVVTAWWMHHGW